MEPTPSQTAPPPPASAPAAGTAPVVPIVAGLIAAAIGPAIWVGVYIGVGAVWIAPLLIGLLVGLAVRLTNRGGPPWVAFGAAGLAALSCFAGYVWTDLRIIQWVDQNNQPVQPAFADAARRFLNDLLTIVFVAVGAYIAYALSRRAPGNTHG